MNIFIGDQGALIDKLEAGSDGRVSSAVLKDGSVVKADTVMLFISFEWFDAAVLYNQNYYFCYQINFNIIFIILAHRAITKQGEPKFFDSKFLKLHNYSVCSLYKKGS